MTKFSLAQQIEEVAREIKLREGVYLGMVRSGRMRASVGEFHQARMRAVLATLEWLRDHQENIRRVLDGTALDPGREAVARWMMARGYATGHGDTIDDLLGELEAQASERKPADQAAS